MEGVGRRKDRRRKGVSYANPMRRCGSGVRRREPSCLSPMGVKQNHVTLGSADLETRHIVAALRLLKENHRSL